MTGWKTGHNLLTSLLTLHISFTVDILGVLKMLQVECLISALTMAPDLVQRADGPSVYPL